MSDQVGMEVTLLEINKQGRVSLRTPTSLK